MRQVMTRSRWIIAPPEPIDRKVTTIRCMTRRGDATGMMMMSFPSASCRQRRRPGLTMCPWMTSRGS
jgi:hypothetical protein